MARDGVREEAIHLASDTDREKHAQSRMAMVQCSSDRETHPLSFN